MSMFGRLGLSMWLEYQNKKCDVINSAISSTLFLLLQESRQNLVWSNNDMWSASYVYLIKPRKKFLRGFELWWACGFKHKLIWWLHTLFDFLYIIGWYQRYFILNKSVLLNKNIWIHGIGFSLTVFICKIKCSSSVYCQ